MTHDAVVIGGGYAGLTAAGALARSGASVAVIEMLGPGGQLLNLPRAGALPGPDRAAELFEDAMTAGADVRLDETVGVRPGEVDTAASGTLRAPAIVLAMGAEPRRLGLPGEVELAGRGVSYCVGCDAGMFRGADTVVLAGGRYAAEEAAQLAMVARTVTFVSPAPADGLTGVRVLTGARPVRVDGSERVSGVTVAIGDGEQTLAAHGVFVCAGSKPRTALVRGVVELAADGGVAVDEQRRASAPGVYAIGDVRAGAPQELAAADADVAAMLEALA